MASVRDVISQVCQDCAIGMTIEQITILCWKRDPLTFQLPGYAEYPDPRKVSMALSGPGGMVAKGLIERGAKNKEGHTLYSFLKKPVKAEPRLPRKTKSTDEQWLDYLVTKTAVQKYSNGLKVPITSLDALEFFGLHNRSELFTSDKPYAIASRIAQIDLESLQDRGIGHLVKGTAELLLERFCRLQGRGMDTNTGRGKRIKPEAKANSS